MFHKKFNWKMSLNTNFQYFKNFDLVPITKDTFEYLTAK
jgi:hypothetical protein